MPETGDVPKIGEGAKKQLKEIGYFRVTDRGLGDYEKYCHFSSKEILNNAVVVDIGSGWNQELSTGLEKLNKGIKTINLDASLAILPENVDEVVYQTFENNKLIKVDRKKQSKRLSQTKENSVAAVMPNIPLKDEVADLIADCYGPATYLEDENWVKYVDEIKRVLKIGAEAHLYPVDSFEDFYKKGVERLVENGDRRLDLLNGKGFSLEKYLQEDESGIARMGVIIKKESCENNLDSRVIKLDYPKGKYSDIDEKNKYEIWNGLYSAMISAQIMEEERFNSMLEDIKTRFAGKEIGMRGILTSLGGDLSVKMSNENITVYDIDKLLQDGVEQIGANEINIAPVGLADEVTEIPHRVEQFFLNSTRLALGNERANESLRDKLFPAIVIYDLGDESPLGKLKDKTDGYHHFLPDNPEDRKKIILGVYPIDVRFTLPGNNNSKN